MGLASIELSFHPCNILRDSRRGVSRRNKNVGCGTWKLRFLTVVNYTIFAAIIDSLWAPAQRKRATMLYFANVFIYLFFMAALFSGPG